MPPIGYCAGWRMEWRIVEVYRAGISTAWLAGTFESDLPSQRKIGGMASIVDEDGHDGHGVEDDNVLVGPGRWHHGAKTMRRRWRRTRQA